MKTLKVLAALLSYPEAELLAAAPELKSVLRNEALLARRDLEDLEALIDNLATGDLLDLQMRYVQLFDRVRSLSLHLFEHVHGDSRARGTALVELGQLYANRGLDTLDGELPDFLPAYLEYLSLLPAAQAREGLGEVQHILEAIGERLRKRQSPYAAVFVAAQRLAKSGQGAPEPLKTEEEDDSAEAMDRQWEEAAVIFGPDAKPDGACPVAGAAVQRMMKEGRP